MSKITIDVNQEQLDFVRRKLTFLNNKDLTSNEVIEILIQNEFEKPSKFAIPRKPFKNDRKSAIAEAIENGSTSTQAINDLGISRSTFFRHKRVLAEQSE